MSDMNETRICIIGGGSRQWALRFMKDLALNPDTHGTLVLYDRNKQAARENVVIAERIFAVNHTPGRFNVLAIDDLQEALIGSDLVIISVEPGSTTCRKGDLLLPEEYGILQTVGDTTGPGGIMRARRSIPMFYDFGKQIAACCPEAWVINYTNPMTLCTAALYRAFPAIKVIGCCHEVFHLQNLLAKKVSQWYKVPPVNRRDVHIDVTGINHFTFITEAKWNGLSLLEPLKEEISQPEYFKDLTSAALERIQKQQWFTSDHQIALTFLKDFDTLGAAGDRHLAEFVPWYLVSDKVLNSYGVVRTPYEWRISIAEEKRTKKFTDEDLVAEPSDEEGVDIMRSLLGDSTMVTNVNLPNSGQISYLPKGRIVESNAHIAHNAVTPLMAKDPPLLIQTMIRRASDIQEMTLDAVLNEDEDALFAAFISDPLVNIPLTKARELFDRMLVESALRYE
jgi:alpha-galactosidase/6-phospho-beta-glucosidase family protein